MNISAVTKMWLAWRASKQITATLASKTTQGQAGVTAAIGTALAFAVALFNAQFPAHALSAEAAAGLIGLILTVIAPVLSRYVALAREPGKVLPDALAPMVRVKRRGEVAWQKYEGTALDAQADGWDYGVVVRGDRDGDVWDLRTGEVVQMIRLPKPKVGFLSEENDIAQIGDDLRDAGDRRD